MQDLRSPTNLKTQIPDFWQEIGYLTEGIISTNWDTIANTYINCYELRIITQNFTSMELYLLGMPLLSSQQKHICMGNFGFSDRFSFQTRG
ncbi:hypothetical protein ACF3DV_19685 [Chlorogloeopsis fritschii PCC 9212]|uniref:hypothetical protein n=1 Tax=Chlorogloeopsis fritschii TaxID=1124 RepID=UPI000F8F62B1|nr:hypothetical protein [Chlorogloeopsis fritschii]